MKLPERFDLHMHSTVSDGTDTPGGLLTLVRKLGLELFSVTDHDAVKGCAGICDLLSAGDPAFLTGVEFNCRDEEGKYHILGYGYDPGAGPIRTAVETGHALRMKKLLSRLDFLETRFGFAFPVEEQQKLLALDNPGKPHIGNLMVRYGYARTKEEAIKNYIDQQQLHAECIRPEEAVSCILCSGGVPVLAHPCFGSGDELILGEALDRRVRKLMDYGLQGLEGFYSGFAGAYRQEVLDLAAKYGLYVTAGSDYHGNNKTVILGDTGLDASILWPEGLHRFLKDISGRIYDTSGR
jgi:predicted metal-dependent phosphoesterase TrpH